MDKKNNQNKETYEDILYSKFMKSLIFCNMIEEYDEETTKESKQKKSSEEQ